MPFIAPAIAAALGGYAASRSGKYTRKLRGTRRRYATKSRYLATRRRPRRMTRGKARLAARRAFALPRNYATAKTTVVKPANVIAKTNQFLNATACIQIFQGPGINERLRDSVVLSGVRIQFACRNLNKYNAFLNWAVISAKGDEDVSTTSPDFFREYDDSRAWNADATGKTGLEWSHAAINLDKYRVHRRGKFLLGAQPGGTVVEASENKDSFKEMDIYVKIGRSITFDATASTPFEQIYFVFWMASPLDGAGRGLGDGFSETTKIVNYYREPKSG